MIQNFILQPIFLLLITFFGYLVVNLISPQVKYIEKISLSFIIGLGLYTFVIFISNWLFGTPIKISPIIAILAWLVMTAIYLNLCFKRKNIFPFQINNWSKRTLRWTLGLSKFEKILFLILVFIFGSLLLSNLYWPIWSWDAVALFDFRARQILSFGQILGSFDLTPGSYPLLTSLAHVLVYIVGGKNPQYLYFLFLLSPSIIFYLFLRRFMERSHSLISLILLTSLPLVTVQTQSALTDLPQSAFLLTGFIYLILGLHDDKKYYVVLSGLLFSLSMWARNEPFWMLAMLVLFIFSFKRKWFILDGVFLATIYAISYPWTNFIKTNAVPLVYAADQLDTHNIPLTNPMFWVVMPEFIFKNIIFPVWPFFLAFLLLLVIRRKNLTEIVKLITFSIFIILTFLVVGTSMFVITYPQWPALYNSLQRMLIFLYALLIADTSLLLFPTKSEL